MDPAQPGFWVMDKNEDAYRTISEAAEELDLPQHVLRFWETRFPQIKPMKRGGGRRYYRPEDLELLRAIRQLLYGEGYTIKGVQRLLTEQGPRQLSALAAGGQSAQRSVEPQPPKLREEPQELDPQALDPQEFAGEPRWPADDAGTPARPVLTATRAATRDIPRHESDGQPAPQGFYAAQGSYLAKADLRALESALAELEECRRILQSVES